MNRHLPLALFCVTVFAFALAQANPLAGARGVAKNTAEAAGQHSEEVAEEAEKASGEEKKDEHADDGHEAHDHADHHHSKHDHDGDDDAHEVEVLSAVAIMLPTEGNRVSGVIRFEQTGLGVVVTAEISGLNPNQKHGFHIHEFGDISDPAGKATGGHYNPEGHDHALPGNAADARHAGDLGNLQADAQGNATFNAVFDNISVFDDDHNPIIGRGLIIHAQPDDGGQPTGNAGARIAQGVIGVANTK